MTTTGVTVVAVAKDEDVDVITVAMGLDMLVIVTIAIVVIQCSRSCCCCCCCGCHYQVMRNMEQFVVATRVVLVVIACVAVVYVAEVLDQSLKICRVLRFAEAGDWQSLEIGSIWRL